ncbi:MAG TPA: aspartate aminotransferase family protein [Verrucomicrobiae bacterium]|nr:aspartate aminotransferase family protein [Verrucomicrobiae bacterium]
MSSAGHLLQNYARAPVTFVSGSGCVLVDADGREYLDCIAGIACCALGHAHPAIAEAIADQAKRLVHTSNLFGHEPAGRLADELARRTGFDRVFFCNSGTEANEAAIKLARKFAWRAGERNRSTIVACEGAFHGRTYGALAATDSDAYKEGFGEMPGGFSFTPFNDVAALDAAIDANTAAFIVEPVQGESGVNPATVEFLQAARRLCDERGAMLIFDEIQCGSGRLGTFCAFERFGVRPDVLTMAKALGNGLPIGAMLCTERVAVGLQPGDHGSTFGGSPVPCAAALAHMRVRDEMGLEARVLSREIELFAGLRALAEKYPAVFESPRGMGLLAALPVRAPYDAKDIVAKARDRGVLFGTAGGNVVRIAPPLVIEPSQLAHALATLGEIAKTL